MIIRDHKLIKIVNCILAFIIILISSYLIYILFNNTFKLNEFIIILIASLIVYIICLIVILTMKKYYILNKNKIEIDISFLGFKAKKIYKYKSLRYAFSSGSIQSTFNISHGIFYLDNKIISFHCNKNIEQLIINYLTNLYYEKTEK